MENRSVEIGHLGGDKITDIKNNLMKMRPNKEKTHKLTGRSL